MNDSYWEGRKDLQYYRTVLDFARKHCPDGTTLLDVGGGVGLGCRYLEWFEQFDRTCVELPTKGCTLEGVPVVHADFLEWEPDRRFDLVLCLQVLEHVPDPTTFARKLFACGDVVIVSAPYRWSATACSEHLHDPVDERKLREWTGREPVESVVADSRLVSVYEATFSPAGPVFGELCVTPGMALTKARRITEEGDRLLGGWLPAVPVGPHPPVPGS